MWERGTIDDMRMFDALFKGVSTLFGPLTIEKCIEHPHFIYFLLPTSSFGEHEIVIHIMHTPKSPNPDCSFVDQTAFRARMNIFKSGISGSDITCLFFWGVMQPSATHPPFWQTCLFTIFQIYAPQTKILEDRANIRERIFKALFKWT